MQIKNKTFKIIICTFFSILFCFNSIADEFNISAVEITVDQKNNILTGKGSVEAKDTNGRTIFADKIIYEKSKEFLKAEGSVRIIDKEGNVLETQKATYDKLNEMIISYNESNLSLNEGYKLKSNSIVYNTLKKIISSDQDSIFTDIDGNIAYVNMFQYQIDKNLFSSIGKIKVIDQSKNKYFFKELHVDTKVKEMIGSDVSVLLDNASFGMSEENDPRFVANDIFITKNESILSKGIFTVCKEREDKCPPWQLKAKKIRHDKIKKTIYYDHATLKVYDIPIFYFPKFFHPDPTVKRQSGFLSPFFTDSTSVGAGFGLPYFWAMSHDKDMTITTKTYKNENILLLNEYRQAFRNGFLTLDTSFTEGYKDTSKTKTGGSRNHIFADLDFNFDEDKDYESKLSFKLQRTSNDTYFRIHDMETALVNPEKTNLENQVSYDFSKDDMYFNFSAFMYEDLRKDSNDRYEYIIPNLLYGKTFFTQNLGSLNLESNLLNKNYDTNKHITFLNNDLVWNANSYITRNGFVNTLKGMIKNRNYEAKNTTDYKADGTVNELSSVVSFKSSLPMRKDSNYYSNVFSPNFMVRYSPGHMRNLSSDSVTLDYSNLYSLNKTSEIEDGLSAVLGFDFKVNDKIKNKEKFSASLGQVFNLNKNQNMPIKSSLHQKMSDVVGTMNYNFSEIGSIDYKFSLDNNFNDLNYNQISTNLNFGRIGFNIDYLEERNHVGREHYMNTGINLDINSNNQLSLSTTKNYRTNSTELYDISYQYKNDCLRAGLVFRREFYQESDIEPKDKLMFVITFVPFSGARAPIVQP
tara:strand:+ start:2261 stop:4678 length:2418 start_codon:yes stop_codon:yes gene_type:complete